MAKAMGELRDRFIDVWIKKDLSRSLSPTSYPGQETALGSDDFSQVHGYHPFKDPQGYRFEAW